MRIINLVIDVLYDDDTRATLQWDLLERHLDCEDYSTLADKRVRLDTLIVTLRELNKKIRRKPPQIAKEDVKRHGRARAVLTPRRDGATTKQGKTGRTSVEGGGVYLGSGARGSGWFRAKRMKRGDGDCRHMIAAGSWFWTDPQTSDIYCVDCAPQGAQ